jgi:hypothetical protein
MLAELMQKAQHIHVNWDSGDGDTLLHVACLLSSQPTADRSSLFEILLDKGTTNINTPNPYGCTPLHFAVQANNAWQVKELIERGADKNAETHLGHRPLDFKPKRCDAAILRLLEDGTDVPDHFLTKVQKAIAYLLQTLKGILQYPVTWVAIGIRQIHHFFSQLFTFSSEDSIYVEEPFLLYDRPAEASQ